MVDEIENGFYYKRMPSIWKAIIKFSHEYSVQLFISTHSKECLEALLPSVNEDPSNFRLLRVEVDEKRNHTIKVFKGKDLASALNTGEADPRGN